MLEHIQFEEHLIEAFNVLQHLMFIADRAFNFVFVLEVLIVYEMDSEKSFSC